MHDKRVVILDIEHNPKKNFTLYGFKSKEGYKYFLTLENALNYIKKFSYVFCYNLEYDFEFFLEYFFLNNNLYLHYHSVGLSYADVYFDGKRQIWKDLAYHCNMKPVKEIAKMIGMKKGKIAFTKMSMENLKEVVEYNKNDCNIEYKIYKRLKKIYGYYDCDKVKASIGGNAFEIYKRYFAGKVFFKIPEEILDVFRKAYKGGYCNAYKKGKFRKKVFTMIDVNSKYPEVMLSKYPLPSSYKKVRPALFDFLYDKEKFYLIITKDDVYTSFEKSEVIGKAIYYIVFTEWLYPFKVYVEHFMERKIKEEKEGNPFERLICKTLMTSLFGKFAQLNIKEILTNERKIKRYKGDSKYNIEEIRENIFRVYWESGYPYWVNFIWSVYTTAKARLDLKESIKKMRKLKLIVYYSDTDSIIFSGDVSKVSDWLDDYEIGKWKIVIQSKELDITGKKEYRIGKKIKCKSVSGIKNQRKFIEKGFAKYKKFVKIKEMIRGGHKAGSRIFVKKQKRVN